MTEPALPVLARWPLPAEHPAFAGHFPLQAVLPGALLLDWVVASAEAEVRRQVTGVRSVKWQTAVTPGRTLQLRGACRGPGFDFVVIDVTASAPAAPEHPPVASGTLVLAA